MADAALLPWPIKANQTRRKSARTVPPHPRPPPQAIAGICMSLPVHGRAIFRGNTRMIQLTQVVGLAETFTGSSNARPSE